MKIILLCVSSCCRRRASKHWNIFFFFQKHRFETDAWWLFPSTKTKNEDDYHSELYFQYIIEQKFSVSVSELYVFCKLLSIEYIRNYHRYMNHRREWRLLTIKIRIRKSIHAHWSIFKVFFRSKQKSGYSLFLNYTSLNSILILVWTKKKNKSQFSQYNRNITLKPTATLTVNLDQVTRMKIKSRKKNLMLKIHKLAFFC